jgi:hypothetical protein
MAKQKPNSSSISTRCLHGTIKALESAVAAADAVVKKEAAV